MTPAVGIVVLSWNGGPHTHAAVESALAQQYPNAFVIVVDNHSSDAEREVLRRRYADTPAVDLHLLGENRGYAGGNNLGIAQALARGADLILILTQDAALAPGALSVLVETALADPRIGIVGPKVVDARQPGQVLSAGEHVSVPLLCVPRMLLRHRRARGAWYPVTGVLGCVMLLTRRCIETIGSFDESLFAYYEEVDLCLRAPRSGFLIACAPGAVATHDGMRGFLDGFTPLSAELKTRNLLRVIRRYATGTDWLLLLPTCGALLLGSATIYAARGRRDIVAALGRGIAAGLRQRGGPVEAVANVR